MRSIHSGGRAAACLIVIAGLSGCAVDKLPELSHLTRNEIEREFGSPANVFETLSGDWYHYKVKIDYDVPGSVGYGVGYTLGAAMIFLGPDLILRELSDRTTSYLVSFDDRDRPERVERVEVWYPKVMEIQKSKESFEHICLHASLGSQKSQEYMGRIFEPIVEKEWASAGIVEPDNVKAFLWYDISGVESLRQRALDRMSERDMAEAKNRAENWSPDPYECLFQH